MTQLRNIIGRATMGTDAYVWALQSAYQSGVRLYDPSYAIDQSADFDELIRRDPVILQSMNDRLASVAGKAWSIQPASDDEDDKDLAMIVESLLRRIRDFRSARRNLSQAIFNGRSYAHVQGERKEIKLPARKGSGKKDAEPRIAVMWVPRRLQDVNAKRVRWGLPAMKGNAAPPPKLEYWSLEKLDWIPVDPNCPIVSVVYDDTEGTLGYGKGLREAIYHYFWAKGTVLREGLQGIERWAQGMVVARLDEQLQGTPDKTIAQVQSEYLTVLKEHRGRHGGIVMSKQDEVDVVFPSGTGQSMVTEFIRMLDDAMTRLITGALLPSGGGASGGSLARAEEEGSTIERVTQLDRDVVDEALTHDLIRTLVKVNRPQLAEMGLGDAEQPRFETMQTKTEDPTKNVAVISGALQAGIPLRKDEVYRKLGFTQPSEDDEVIEQMPPSPDAMLGSMDGAEDRESRAQEAKAKAKQNGAEK